MPYLPIAQSGLSYSFASTSGAQMNGSLVSANSNAMSRWEIDMADGTSREFKVTNLGYATSGPGTQLARLEVPSGSTVLQQFNTSASPLTQFQPNPVTLTASPDAGVSYLAYYGSTSGGTVFETYAWLVEVNIPTLSRVGDKGRVSKEYATAYSRTRVHQMDIYGPELRATLVEFKSVIPEGQTIVRADFDTYQGCVINLSSPAIEGSRIGLAVQGGYPGRADLRMTAYLSGGAVLVQWFVIHVCDAPIFQGDPVPINAGPTHLSVTV